MFIETLQSINLQVIYVIYGVLLFSEMVLWYLKRQSNGHYLELTQRIRSWWVMVSIFAVTMLLGNGLAYALIGLVCFIALKEYFSMIPTRRVDRRVIFWAYITIPIQFYCSYVGGDVMFMIFIPVYMFLFIPIRMILMGKTHHFLRSVGSIHWGLMMTVYCLSHSAHLLIMPIGVDFNAGNKGLLLFLVLMTQFNDVAQYCWGKWLGRIKILPSISPGKTLAGFLGGLVSSVVLAWFMAPLLTPFTTGFHAVALGLLISIFGFWGDVNISALKRDMKVKDTGQLIPGHGGLLDRVDSLTFTAPLFFHFVRYYVGA